VSLSLLSLVSLEEIGRGERRKCKKEENES